MSPQLTALKKHFNLDAFRYPQDEIVQAVLDGKNAMVIMPTGGGKSLCFQLPAMLLPGVTVVISPLIALMKDQVDALKNKGIPAAMINSSQSWNEQKACLDDLRNGEIKLVYVAPERFRAKSFTDSLAQCKVSLFAIDEAHCISQWGHDFRPDYMRIGTVLKKLGQPQCIALTATATPEVRDDILHNLQLETPETFISGFARPNLQLNVRTVKTKREKFARLSKLIEKHGVAIIYCATRKSVEAVSQYLKEDGKDHIAYHGGLNDRERESAQNKFISGETSIAVATNAFGMGIDRSDIRVVCHFEMPGSVEAYYQEAGRAGRDGKPSVCEMLFLYADKRIQDFFIDGANPGLEVITAVYAHLRNEAGDNYEVFMPMDELCYRIGKKTNGMAVSSAMSILRRQGIIDRFDVAGSRAKGTRLLQPDLSPQQINLSAQDLLQKRKRDEGKLKKLVQLAYAPTCRQQWILQYFGEAQADRCENCDNCLSLNLLPTIPLNEHQSLILRKALSGVARMSTRRARHEWEAKFGRDRIIKCLVGSKAKTILAANLDKLSTWGLLKDHTAVFVGDLFDAMLQQGLVQVTDGEYPLLQLTTMGSQVMLEESTSELAWPEIPTGMADDDDFHFETGLYDLLLKKRNEIRSKKGNVPAYTIFPNLVLKKLAAQKPSNAEEAMTIKGIGQAKADTILPEFLEIIENYDA